MYFDEARLDDDSVLSLGDLRLRGLAESGARIRAEARGVLDAAAHGPQLEGRPRAMVAAGPDSRLLRSVLEPTCPVPLIAWPTAGLPGWAGALDLVVVLAPDGGDTATVTAVAEARRRGCQVIIAAPSASVLADYTDGPDALLLPTTTEDPLAVAIGVLAFLADLGLGPATDADQIAGILDEVAVESSPHRELTTNPAKLLALGIGDSTPVLWGGSTMAARAARRIAESFRRASGRASFAGDLDQVRPVLEAARVASIFDDPVDDPMAAPPVLVLVDAGPDVEDPLALEQRRVLTSLADERNLRVEVIAAERGGDTARYARLVLAGSYAAEYLRLGLVVD